MRILFYWSLLALTCGYALARGRRHERLAATVCILASLAMPFVLAPFAARYQGFETGVAFVDIGVLVAFVLIALDSDRFWPLWIAGLQLTASMSHMLKAISSDLMWWAYGAAGQFWSYPILLIIAVATWRSRRRAQLAPAG
jgi:hypothetical protein